MMVLLLVHPSFQIQHLVQKEKLYIGGLFGIDTSGGGWNSAGIIPAVQMAFDDINNSSSVLSEYHLELLVKDSQVKASLHNLLDSFKCRTT